MAYTDSWPGSFICKFNKSGELVWAKNGDFVPSIATMMIDHKDQIHVIASNFDWESHYRYMKYDTNWNPIPSENVIALDASSFTSKRQFQIVTDEEANYYLALDVYGSPFGSIQIGDTVFNLENRKRPHYISKFSEDNELLWVKRLYLEFFDNFQMASDSEGGLIISGTFEGDLFLEDSIISANSVFIEKVFCMRLDSLGNLTWAKVFGGRTTQAFGNDMAVTDKHIYLTGTLISGTYTFGSLTIDNANYDPFILDLDLDGNINSIRVLSVSGFSSGRRVIANKEGDILLNGYYESSFSKVDSFDLPFTHKQELFFAVLDSNLNVKAVQSITGREDDHISNMHWGGEDQIYVSGYFDCNAEIGEETLEKDETCMNLNRFDGFLASLTFQSIPSNVSNKLEDNFLSIYPNPSLPKTDIWVELDQSRLFWDGRLEISNAQGQRVYEQKINQPRFQIDLSHLVEGVYFVKVYNTEMAMTKKLVIMD